MSCFKIAFSLDQQKQFYYKSRPKLKSHLPEMSSSHSPVTFSTDDYAIPNWSALPQHKFFFEVIKQGSIVGTIQIKRKQFSLVGRLEDLCDIFIDNPTVSRKHAILQFQSEDPLPLLYDLGSAQGTFVNKEKLPPKAYKKLQLFANIKFGVSSRCYILRCLQLQQKQNEDEEQKQNNFLTSLSQQNKALSKKQAKKKYLQLLENDPYFGGQLKSRKFEVHQNIQQEIPKQYEGITWGIGDQNEVYAYKNEKEFQIEPDVLRRLPGLDSNMLEKIAQYEEKFRIYDEIESQLNELTNRQKRQFGFEEKFQNKKEKLEKKFVQSLQALEKCEEWIRVNIFGDENKSRNNQNRKKQKEADTFSDDEFYDRTLENKNAQKEKELKDQKLVQKGADSQQQTVEDLWMLKNTFLSELARKKQLLTLEQSAKTQRKENDRGQYSQIQLVQTPKSDQEADQLEQFMRVNDQNLQQQNMSIYSRQISSIEDKLSQLKQKLLKFLSSKEIKKLEEDILNPQKKAEKETKKQQKQAQEKQKLQKTLQKIQIEQKNRQEKQLKRQQLQKQCEDEYSEKIFQLYKEQIQDERNLSDEEEIYKQKVYPAENDEGHFSKNPYRYPNKKLHPNQNHSNPDPEINRQNQGNEEDQSRQEEVVDLTKNFN